MPCHQRTQSDFALDVKFLIALFLFSLQILNFKNISTIFEIDFFLKYVVFIYIFTLNLIFVAILFFGDSTILKIKVKMIMICLGSFQALKATHNLTKLQSSFGHFH